MMNTIRQGDLLFIRISPAVIPPGAVVRPDGIIARGEATGHTHRLVQGVLLAVAARLYVRAAQACEVIHEEHHPVALPAGDWEVRRQIEYNPDGWRQVAD